jgi:hypothetical protein
VFEAVFDPAFRLFEAHYTMKKKKLEAELSFEFSLIALISELKEYKLAWHLNTALDIQLVKKTDIELEFLKGQNLLISNYFFETEHSYIRLLKNKSIVVFGESPAYLLPELNRFDYLILVCGYEDTLTMTELKSKISEIPKVQYVQVLGVENLKSKENLIF